MLCPNMLVDDPKLQRCPDPRMSSEFVFIYASCAQIIGRSDVAQAL